MTPSKTNTSRETPQGLSFANRLRGLVAEILQFPEILSDREGHFG